MLLVPLPSTSIDSSQTLRERARFFRRASPLLRSQLIRIAQRDQEDRLARAQAETVRLEKKP